MASSATVVVATPGSGIKRQRQDPWIEMEKQMTETVNDLMIQHTKFTNIQNKTVVAENELRGLVDAADDLLGDMEAALSAVENHPESFDITTQELQRRQGLVKQWKRDVQRPKDEVAVCERKRNQAKVIAENAAAAGVSYNAMEAAQNRRNEENGDYLRREYEAQVDVMAEQDKAADRIHAGVIRIKSNATLIQEELDRQNAMMNDADTAMSKLQTKLDGALKKVNKLLDESSDKKKFICIFVLLVILALLIFLLFGN